MTSLTQIFKMDGTAGLVLTQYFYGTVPATQAKFDALAEFAANQRESYIKLGSGNPDLGPYEAMGYSMGIANPGKLNLTQSAKDFFASQYEAIVGRPDAGGGANAIAAQEGYFKTLYLADGMGEATAAAAARGAALGQLLGHAVNESTSVYATGASNFWSNYLTDGEVEFGKPLPSYEPDTTTVEVIKEVIKEVPVIKEVTVIKEVIKEVIVEVPVEVPVEPPHSVLKIVDGILDPTGHKPGVPGEIYIGGGGNMATNYQITKDLSAGTEIGLKGHVRTAYDYTSESVDADGKVIVKAMSGIQTGGNINDGYAQSDNAARSHLSVDFSVNFGTSKLTETPLNAKLYIDLDPTENINFSELTLDKTLGAWVDADGIPRIGNDAGRPGSLGHVAQDSFNYGFTWLSSNIDGVGPAGSGDIPAGFYDVKLAIYGENGTEYSSQSVQYQLVDELVPVINPTSVLVTDFV